MTAFAAALNVFATIRQKIRSPEVTQNERIKKLEEYVSNDNDRLKLLEQNYLKLNTAFETIEESTTRLQQDLIAQRGRMESVEHGERVTQWALLALMSHMINADDGQDKSRLIEARDKLNEYLLEK